MAGDWIRMRVDLHRHPKVMRAAELMLADADYLNWSGLSFGLGSVPEPDEFESRSERYTALRVTRYVCVTALLRFWGYANEHAKGEYVENIGPNDVDEIAGIPNFGVTLVTIGWAIFRPNGGVDLPGFAEHNTTSEKRKSSSAERQKAYRERQKQGVTNGASRVTSRVTQRSDVTSRPREEKRRIDTLSGVTAVTAGAPADGFSKFWAAYPRKKAKGDAEKAWAKIRPNEQLTERIVAAVEQATTSADWRKDGGQFIPHPATWLNRKGWEDEIIVTRPTHDPNRLPI